MVNPTRMELKKLKARLKTAARGHKLLKDKSDEMVRQFTQLIRENKRLREEVEGELSSALKQFMLARSVSSSEQIEEALMYPAMRMKLSCSVKNVMSVKVPAIAIAESREEGGTLPYSLFSVSAELDSAIITLSGLMGKLVRLAEVEKTCNQLADEIQKNKRRVNALEYVMIPNLEKDIKYIAMKLDENERGALVRLMKVKDMIENRQ